MLGRLSSDRTFSADFYKCKTIEIPFTDSVKVTWPRAQHLCTRRIVYIYNGSRPVSEALVPD
ncbi:hypothetical protein DPMN_091562 [Dreissena polymorpha]|uniref:Uncharacterized protein n=1 Tax=Dreissena polymorpha TaxID=45954 RepID=A0A9D4QZ82_DREPO|nr:hypothetical protein DPMN_091562 [Dreissena polymorpha]